MKRVPHCVRRGAWAAEQPVEGLPWQLCHPATAPQMPFLEEPAGTGRGVHTHLRQPRGARELHCECAAVPLWPPSSPGLPAVRVRVQDEERARDVRVDVGGHVAHPLCGEGGG